MRERPEGYDKLPRRFRWHIERLEQSLALAQREIETLTGTSSDPKKRSRIIVDPYADAPRYLPNETRIAFDLSESGEGIKGDGANERIILSLDHVSDLVMKGDGGYFIRIHRGDYWLKFYPESANSGRIK